MKRAMPMSIAMAAAGARAPPRFPEGRRPTVYEAALAAQVVACVGLCLGMFGIADPPRETLLAIAMFAWGVRIGWKEESMNSDARMDRMAAKLAALYRQWVLDGRPTRPSGRENRSGKES